MADIFTGRRAGVLIIGSLGWQDYLDQPGDQVRLDWRNRHLAEDEKLHVYAPIRYGRLAKDGVYTMVFARSAIKEQGTAWAVPFRHKEIREGKHLEKELLALSTAAGMKTRMIATEKAGGSSKVWGVVGIILNSEKIGVDASSSMTAVVGEETSGRSGICYFQHPGFLPGTGRAALHQPGGRFYYGLVQAGKSQRF